MKKAQKVRLGIFVLISSLLLLVLIGYFAARNLFERQENYYVAFSDVSVSGLEVGSSVKFMGIDVGSIASIRIDPDDVNTIIVELTLQEGTPVKEDAKADIVAMGITGLKTIEIRGGSEEADFLEPGDYIPAGSSLAEDLTGKAEVIYLKLEQVLNNLEDFTAPDNIRAFSEAAENIGAFAVEGGEVLGRLDGVVAENREDVKLTVSAVRELSGELSKTSDELFAGVSRFNEIMQGDTLGEVLGNFREISLTLRETNLNELIEQLAQTTMETQNLLRRVGEDVDRGSEALTDNLLILEYTLKNMHDVSRKISTNPSVLIRRPKVEGSPDQILDDQ
ncbi:MAG: MlaD family protein [Bacteroidales bacterium]